MRTVVALGVGTYNPCRQIEHIWMDEVRYQIWGWSDPGYGQIWGMRSRGWWDPVWSVVVDTIVCLQ
jgi:hypothetical protein